MILGTSMFFASLFNFFGGSTDPIKKNEALMNSIVESSIKQLKSRYGLIPVGRGGGNKDDKSKREYVAFQVRHKLTKEEARVLLVEIVELFLHNINGNPNIAHYLYNNPFTYHNLEFRVFVLEKDGSDSFDPDIGLVSLTRRGTVNYVTYMPGTLSNRSSDVEESYEEAYKIVTQGTISEPRSSS